MLPFSLNAALVFEGLEVLLWLLSFCYGGGSFVSAVIGKYTHTCSAVQR